MKKQPSYPHLKNWLVLSSLTTFLCLGTPVSAQTQPAQNNQSVQDNDITRQELARFDQFLDDHREIAEQLRKDPSLVDNPEYEKSHPELQSYLENHPNIREEIKENPNVFMRKEDRYDRHEGDRDRDHDTTRGELARFDQFLDGHPEVARELRRDPSLVDNQEYEKNHPELQAYLADHPQIREAIKENPNAFMREEDRYDRHEGDRDGDHDRGNGGRGDNDTTRGELARFDQFLDSHREIAEDLRKDPSLVNDAQYAKNHPALQAYLTDHPQIREEIKENPDAFMRLESRYDRREDARDDDNRYDRRDGDRDGDHDSRGNGGRGDNDTTRGEVARFDQFLDSHREIAEQLRKDPSLVNNQKFESTHPALHTYLQDHPQVREEIKENPNAFMRQEDRYDHQENGHTNYVDRDSHEQAARFGKFLNSHSNVANELSRDPSVVKNQEFMENHPELRDYLKDNPDVQKELMANPPTFVKSAKEFSTDKGRPAQTPTQSQSPSSTVDPKPKQ